MPSQEKPCVDCLQALRSVGTTLARNNGQADSDCYVCAALRQAGDDREHLGIGRAAESRDDDSYLRDVIIYSDHLAGQQIGDSERHFVPQSTVDLSLVATWLATCEADHGSACSAKKFNSAGDTGAGILLIDLQDMCIVPSTLEARFVCLSYVWGGVKQLKLTREWSEASQTPGALKARMDQIPQTIRDTMTVARGLRERYVWIDCLCIIQDDAEHRRTQIAQMAAIYGAGLLTMVAVASQDANSPVPGVTAGSRRPGVLKGTSRTVFAQEPANLVGLNDILVGTKHQSRAWTFQEVELSRRCLFFANDQVYFQCQSTRSREALGPACNTIGQKNRAGNFPSLGSDVLSVTFRWEETLLDFSGRDLTFPTDRLDALSAVTKAFEIAHGCRFLYGLEMEHWHWSLLWLPSDTRNHEASQKYNMYPSWSWLSHEGGVFHAGYFRGAMAFQTQVDWSYAFVWDGQRAHSVHEDKSHSDVAMFKDRPAGVLVFGAWKLRISSAGAPPKHLAPIAFDPHPVGESRVASPFDASITARQAENPGDRQALTNLVTDEGVWCGALLNVDPAQLLGIKEDSHMTLELIPLSLSKINWCHFWLDSRKDREETDNWKMMNVMLVKTGRWHSQRVAVGQILLGAWKQEAAEAELFWLI